MHLFTYGTLMDSVIMDRVAGETFSSVTAHLSDHHRKQVKDAVFPAIAPKVSHQVMGILYFDVTEQAMGRLDRFEGDLYWRKPVSITLENQQTLQAFAYIIKPENEILMSEQEWHLERFKQEHRGYFKSAYEGFRKLK